MVPEDDSASAAPIDRAVLETLQARFDGLRLTESARIVADPRLHLRVDLASEYYPTETAGRFKIRWYRNGDFPCTIKNSDRTVSGSVGGIGTRTPTTHGITYHPPPKASRTDAADDQWPADHRDVCRLVLDFVEARVTNLWKQR